MKLMKKILLQLVCVFVLLSFTLSTVFANATTFTNAYPLEVISENGIYYIEDPEYPMEYIVVYCMNNLLNWPHKMDDVDPPNYVYCYLEPDDIENAYLGAYGINFVVFNEPTDIILKIKDYLSYRVF